MTQRVIYISGPMTGVAENNFPAFDRARDLLTARGDIAISPADMDRKFGYCSGSRAYAARDVSEILRECHGIYLLKGWTQSYGEAGEFFLARWIAKDEPDFVFECESGSTNPLHDFLLANLPCIA